MRVLLILNPGSATFKFEFFALADNGEATPRYRGLVDGVGRDSARLLIERISDNSVAEDRQIQPASHPDALAAAIGKHAGRGGKTAEPMESGAAAEIVRICTSYVQKD